MHSHYCQEELRSLSIFLPARNCHERALQGMPADCPMHKGHQAPSDEKEKNCCDDRVNYLKDDQEAMVQLPSLIANSQVAFVLLAVRILPATQTDRRSIQYYNYKPPLIVCDRSLVLQTFLF